MKVLFSLACLFLATDAFVVQPKSLAKTSQLDMVGMTPEDFKSNWDPQRKVPIPPTVKEAKGTNYRGDVMLQHSHDWPFALAAHVPIFLAIYPYPIGVAMAGFHAILAALTWSQANRVRCVMGKDSFELFNLSPYGDSLREKPSNYVKGTINRWYYKDITDLAFWPSQKYPFIVYFKETATSRDKDGRFGWWGKFAELHDPTGVQGKNLVPGQPHFMPGLFNVDEFVDELAKHGVKPRENYWSPNYLPKN